MSVKARVHFAVLSFCLSVVASSVALAQHEGYDHATAGNAAQAQSSGDPYLLDTDAATGEKLVPLEKQVVIENGGRELSFNSEYSLATCVVSGEELGGAMGAPIDYVVGNRLIRLCCNGCKKKVAKDPLSFLAKLDAARSEGEHAETGHGSGHDDHDHHHGDKE